MSSRLQYYDTTNLVPGLQNKARSPLPEFQSELKFIFFNKWEGRGVHACQYIPQSTVLFTTVR